MKTTMFFVVVLAALASAEGQIQCTTVGNQTNCTDWNAIGRNIGNGIVANTEARERHRRAKFCSDHPGQIYGTERCPTFEDTVAQTATLWIGRHHHYAQTSENASAMTAYIEAHNLNPTRLKSYDVAFKQLKKEGKVACQ